MPTLGVIYGNRDFFPDHLVTAARQEVAERCQRFGINIVALNEADSKLGGVD